MSINFEVKPSKNCLPVEERKTAVGAPKFGRTFTDHMVTIEWGVESGWGTGTVSALTNLSIHPATSVLHYAQEIFEGMKAYRRADGTIGVFRPFDHAKRFNSSATRMTMPTLPEELFVEACEQLVRIDSEWVGKQPGSSIYLRPFMVSTSSELGASNPPTTYLFSVIACPTAATGGKPQNPISVWASTTHVRSFPGGTGAAKTGANYAMSLLAQVDARDNGCEQVLWLDGIERKWLEELGAMNLFLVWGAGPRGVLTTPPLSDTLLPGITRDSILQIAQTIGVDTEERPISIDEWKAGCADGSITEAFATGTAAGLTPVKHVKRAGDEWDINRISDESLTELLAQRLNEAHTAAASDWERWSSRLG